MVVLLHDFMGLPGRYVSIQSLSVIVLWPLDELDNFYFAWILGRKSDSEIQPIHS